MTLESSFEEWKLERLDLPPHVPDPLESSFEEWKLRRSW